MNRLSYMSWLLKSTAICVIASIPLAVKAAEPNDQVSVGSVPGAMPNLITDLTEVSPAQVTSVSQLSDVQPTDWAFQALQS